MIRRFQPEDLDDIIEIETGAFPKTPYDIRIFLEWSQQMPDTFLVCEDEQRGKVVAYILFWRTGHIASLAVSEECRCKGIGTELVERVLYFSGGYARIEVRRSNKAAKDFYIKNGFKEIGVVEDYYPQEDAMIMERFDR